MVRCFVFLAEEGALWLIRHGGAIGESLSDVARLEMRVVGRRGKVCAARNGDGAEPGLVCIGTIVAVAGEGVHGGGGCVACNLLEGFVKILVGVIGVGVIGEG